MRLGKIPFNLLATTFDTILQRVLQREIGRNSDTREGLFTLGISVMKVLFKD